MDRKVRLNDAITFQYIADTGADDVFISLELVNKLISHDQMLGEHLEKFSEPIVCQLATKQQIAHVVGVVKLDMQVQTVAGTLDLKKVACQVVQEPMDAILFGNTLLKLLGIDVDKQLASLAGKSIDCGPNEADEVKNDYLTRDHLDYPLGATIDSDLKNALDKMLAAAASSGLPATYLPDFKSLTFKFIDVWRLKLGADPPAAVPPLKIRLRPGSLPRRCTTRKYSAIHRKFLDDRVKLLVKFGLAYVNNDSRYANPAYVVPKVPKPRMDHLDEDYRMTVDMRPTNSQVVPLQWPMPNLDIVVEHLAGAEYFMVFDFFKGYWQLPLHDESQEAFSFSTGEQVITPRRVIMGATDAVMYFQSTMQQCFKDRLYQNLIIWVDDLLAYGKTVDELLDVYGYILQTCEKYRLKLNAKKCSIFQLEAKFCGKLASSEGIRHDPIRMKALAEIPLPENAGDLQQFLCAMNWMHSSLPDFPRQSSPLRRKLEMLLKHKRKTKRVAKTIPLRLSEEEVQCFESLKHLVMTAVSQAHPNPEAEFCLFTDASMVGWAAVLFQVQQYDSSLPIYEQRLEPLRFLGGNFRGASANWAIPEKEAYAIVESIERLDYLLVRDKGFRILCDHRNLIYMFSAGNTNMKMPTSLKLQRWALRLQGYRYTIEHIDGDNNLWADLLSRWGRPGTTLRASVVSRLPIINPLDDNFIWPTLTEIKHAQAQSRVQMRADLQMVDGILKHHNRIWIPEADESLKTRCMIVAHYGSAGHRGTKPTLDLLQRYCYWQKQRSELHTFLETCLHCLHTKGGRLIPRPFGETMQANDRNQVLHFDFLEIGLSYNGLKYLLVLKDGLSQYVELVPCASACAAVVIQALLDWFKRFGIVSIWVSDQGSHFKNNVMTELQKRLRSRHHFTTAYCPWANGTVERVNRDILSVLRTLASEMGMPLDSWPLLIPLVQFVLNQTATTDLENLAPIQVFLGMEPTSMMREIFDDRTDVIVHVPTCSDTLRAKYDELQLSLREIRSKIVVRKANRRTRNRKSQRGVKMPNFSVGDYVLWSRFEQNKPRTDEKLMVIWKGPYHIVGTVTERVYLIEHLITRKRHQVLANRLKFYHDSSLEVTTELTQHLSCQGIDLDVEAVRAIRFNTSSKIFELEISWLGFEEVENSWESFIPTFRSIPHIVIPSLIELSHGRHAAEVKQLCNVHGALIATLCESKRVSTDGLPLSPEGVL
jgi:transposase InsO family protein